MILILLVLPVGIPAAAIGFVVSLPVLITIRGIGLGYFWADELLKDSFNVYKKFKGQGSEGE